MRTIGTLFIFLNLIGLLGIWASQSVSSLDSDIQIISDFPQSEITIQQSPIQKIGEPLPNSFVPERPVVRAPHYFFEAQFILEHFSGLSANYESKGRTYQKLALCIDSSLPGFLIVFPHHYFT
ncbi:hypothetical protein B0E43_13960 [Algoriphagus sp. A40]|nr:hypothetical protein B0E43_13960 [Algoriphagus sp. A40]